MPEPADPSNPDLRPAALTPAAAASLAADRAADHADRARRNGACSRGPVTAAGKSAASRNALRHGLCARVHLVLPGEDGDAFTALAADVLDDVAPLGAVASFLAGRLAAAMWQTGRADRLEAQAFAAGATPDPDRLRLALRYRGSIGRDLFRTLRELRPQLQAAASARAEAPPSPATAGDDDLQPPSHALHGWAGPRVEPGPACSQPREQATTEPKIDPAVDHEPPDPSPDDPAIVLRHGLRLADLLAPGDEPGPSEPDLWTAGRADAADRFCPGAPAAAAVRQNEPGALAASTNEPEPWRAGRSDPADRGRPSAPAAAAARQNEPSALAASTSEPEPWASAPPEAAGSDGPSRPLVDSACRNEPGAPRRDTVDPESTADPSDSVGSPHGAGGIRAGRLRQAPGSAPPPGRAAGDALSPAGGMPGPAVDTWSRLWGLTPPPLATRPPPGARRESSGGHTITAHPSDDARQRAGNSVASPGAAEDGASDAPAGAPAAAQVAPPPRDGEAGSTARYGGRRRVLSRQRRAMAALATERSSPGPASTPMAAPDATGVEPERTPTPPRASSFRWKRAVG